MYTFIFFVLKKNLCFNTFVNLRVRKTSKLFLLNSHNIVDVHKRNEWECEWDWENEYDRNECNVIRVIVDLCQYLCTFFRLFRVRSHFCCLCCFFFNPILFLLNWKMLACVNSSIWFFLHFISILGFSSLVFAEHVSVCVCMLCVYIARMICSAFYSFLFWM